MFIAGFHSRRDTTTIPPMAQIASCCTSAIVVVISSTWLCCAFKLPALPKYYKWRENAVCKSLELIRLIFQLAELIRGLQISDVL